MDRLGQAPGPSALERACRWGAGLSFVLAFVVMNLNDRSVGYSAYFDAVALAAVSTLVSVVLLGLAVVLAVWRKRRRCPDGPLERP